MDDQTGVPAQQHEFSSAWKLFRPSIHALSVNFWTFFGLVVSPLIVLMACFTLVLVPTTGAVHVILAIISILVGIGSITLWLVVYPAATLTLLHGAQGQKIEVRAALKAGLPFVWRYFGLSFLTTLVTLVGFILLIVPGFFMLKRYLLAPYYLVNENLGPIEAMKRSAHDSKEYKGAVWGIVGINTLISVPSIVPLLGWLVSGIGDICFLCAPAVRYLEIAAVKNPSSQGTSFGAPTQHPTTTPSDDQSSPFAGQFGH